MTKTSELVLKLPIDSVAGILRDPLSLHKLPEVTQIKQELREDAGTEEGDFEVRVNDLLSLTPKVGADNETIEVGLLVTFTF